MNKVFCVSVRYLSQETAAPITRLYRLIPVENRDADGLFQSLQAAHNKDDIALNKVIGFASEGENLMQRTKQLCFDKSERGNTTFVCAEMFLPFVSLSC